MSFLIFGLSHHTAELAARERLAVSDADLPSVLADVAHAAGLSELVLLSTCNRTEFHAACDDPVVAAAGLRMWCGQRMGLPQQVPGSASNDAENLFYSHVDQQAQRHLMTVACGLDSMVLGEPQILGQLKSAFSASIDAGHVRQQLHPLFRHVFATAKQVRSETAIGANPVSVASAAVRLSKRVFSNLSENTALLIGAGDTVALAARHLKSEGINRILVANRTLERGQALVDEVGGRAVMLEDLPQVMPEADIIISSTASRLPLIGKGMVEQALKQRKNRPMFIVDIAVPRDVEPQVSELDNIYLYSVDDLSDIVDENLRERQTQAKAAESIIDRSLQTFQSNSAERGAAHAVTAYRRRAESMRDAELAKARQALEAGKDPQQVMESLARSLTNKLTHSPSLAMKAASAENEHEKLRWAETLLGFDAAVGADDGRNEKP